MHQYSKNKIKYAQYAGKHIYCYSLGLTALFTQKKLIKGPTK